MKLKLLSYSFLLMVGMLFFNCGIYSQQSTTGPEPQKDTYRGASSSSDAQVIISDVPSYLWQHGCGPTAVGMVVGYYDSKDYELIGGDASTQTNDVNNAIANDEHYNDYSLPLDEFPNPIQLDLSSLGGAHASNCIGDFMETSWSSENNYYGWSWWSRISASFIDYVNMVEPLYQPTATGQTFNAGSWDDYCEQIDNDFPVVLLVDSDGDGGTDHFVTGIGYDDATNQYGIFDTWDNAVHWFDWTQMTNGVPWGIYGFITFSLENYSIDIQSPTSQNALYITNSSPTFDITVSVFDNQDVFVSTLGTSDFNISVGNLAVSVNSITVVGNQYSINCTLLSSYTSGPYDLKVDLNTSIPAEVDIETNAIIVSTNILIDKGLAYLASIQSTSKGYESGMGTSIEPNVVQPLPKAIGQWVNPGTTALCLQVFLNNGHNINDPLYGTVVANAINYLLAAQISSGYHIGAFGSNEGYETAQVIFALKLATITPLNGGGFISGTLATDINDALDLALNYYTQDVQDAWTTVSWRYDRSYTSQLSGDMSVNQWVFLAFDIMDYNGKDIWNKIYGYLNTKSCSSGDYSYIGYQSCNTWERGNTCAGTWGAVLAADKGVAAANTLKTRYYNYLDNYTLPQLIDPGQINTNHVYNGGGYYYYLYEFSKAMALGNQTIFAGGDWYVYLYNAIEGQHLTDGNGNYYWNQWGGQGYTLETALALLCIQTQSVPVGSTLKISLNTNPGDAKEECFEFTVYDEQGNSAGNVGGSWYTNIPLSEWTSTTGDFNEFTVEVQESTNYSVQIKNICFAPASTELCFKTFLEDQQTDEECFLLEDVPPFTPIGATGFVNAIGGLNVIIVVPPRPLPNIQIDPAVVAYNPFEFDQTYNFQFDIKELGDTTSIVGINIFASDLVDQNGNVIPATAYTITPNNIPVILAGGTETVDVTLVTPTTLPNPVGLFQGVITIQTPDQTRALSIELGKPEMSINPMMAAVPFTAGSGNFALDFTGQIGVDWTITSDAAWLTATPDMGDNDATLTFNYPANMSAVERIGIFTITAPMAANTELTFVVTQAETSSQADQAIDMPVGWLGISSFIIPEYPALETVFAGIEDDVAIMISMGGLYWPSQGINTIGNWNTYVGYKIKILQPTMLELFGFPAETTVDLPAGISYMPVLSPVEISTDIFIEMGDDLLYAFNFQDQTVFWPEGGLNTIGTVEPGVGYLVNLINPVTVDFDMKGSVNSQPTPQFINSSPWDDVVNTGNPHIISIAVDALDMLESGDYIGAFDNNGTIAGITEYIGGNTNLQLIAYGDDFTTSVKDGFADGEIMTFMVYKANQDQVYQIEVSFSDKFNNGVFEAVGLTMITDLKLGALGFGDQSATQFNAYPNPTSGQLNISANSAYTIEMINVAGQIAFRTTIEGDAILDLSKLEKGVYFMKASNENNLMIEKLIIK